MSIDHNVFFFGLGGGGGGESREKMLKNEPGHEILELILFVNRDSSGAQSHQTLHCLYTQSGGIDEGSDKKLGL